MVFGSVSAQRSQCIRGSVPPPDILFRSPLLFSATVWSFPVHLPYQDLPPYFVFLLPVQKQTGPYLPRSSDYNIHIHKLPGHVLPFLLPVLSIVLPLQYHGQINSQACLREHFYLKGKLHKRRIQPHRPQIGGNSQFFSQF